MTKQTHNAQGRSKKALWIIGVLLFLGIVYGIYWLKPTQAPNAPTPANTHTKAQPELPQHNAPEPTDTTQVSQKQAAPIFKTGLENLPRSLEGTDVDGEIIIDENKQLVVTNGLRRLFDYFLTTQGEEDLATIIARIEAYVTHRVPEPARSQVISLLHDYIDYLQATSTISEAGGKPASQIDIDAVIEQKRQLGELRKSYFNKETIEAFFGDEDRYDAYSIGLLKVDRDKKLSAEQKVAAREKLLNELPDSPMKTQIIEQKKFSTLVAETRRLKQEGASATEIRNLRVKLYGTEAADRLAVLDQKRDAWQQRVSTYLTERQTILNTEQGASSKDLQINELRDRMFTELEQKRLTAYEELGTADIDKATQAN